MAKVRSTQTNSWFTADHVNEAFEAICNQFLDEEKLNKWLLNYEIITSKKNAKRIGIICAGNIPMVGFHDIMCVITAGHQALVKLSHKDQYLLPAIFQEFKSANPSLNDRIVFVDKLIEYDAVIATGSNNSLRYFKSYFSHVPHLFRHNRTSVALVPENISDDELHGIARDIFLHFGLGCRNISKLFIDRKFELDRLFKATLKYSNYSVHSKYNNNFIYHTALFQMNKVDYLTNDLFILLESKEYHAPLSIVYFEYVDDIETAKRQIEENLDVIQTVYYRDKLNVAPTTAYGSGQQPELWDYADGVDVMTWLTTIKVDQTNCHD